MKEYQEFNTIKKEIESRYSDFLKYLQTQEVKAEQLQHEIEKKEKSLDNIADRLALDLNLDKIAFLQYLKKPTVTIKKDNAFLVYSPKWHKFQYGWWVGASDEYNIYKIDHYTKWFSNIPDFLESQFSNNTPNITIDGDKIRFNAEDIDKVKKMFPSGVTDYSSNEARITRGNNFEILAQIIEAGRIPFKQNPVLDSDLTSFNNINLREHQKEAWDAFLKTGAVGVFLPTGAGKSFIAMKAMESLKGKHLVVTLGITLVEQWKYYIETYIPHRKDDITVLHYQSATNLQNQYTLIVFDECHRLPATTFSKFALLNTKYRLGLSATPYREDNKQKYIVALTGFPVGTDWQKYLKESGRESLHMVNVHVVETETKKLKIVKSLFNPNKKTWIFSDSIQLGQRIAADLKIPFVNGTTQERMEVINDNKAIVISRVGDMGISVKDLEHIIEVDFQFGSRQQEVQRTGRLMHSESSSQRHDIVMTQYEFSQYGKRIWVLQEKGFQVKVFES